jgi:hypothetical protein
MNKDFMEREGTLPKCLKVSDDAYEVVFMNSDVGSSDDETSASEMDEEDFNQLAL